MSKRLQVVLGDSELTRYEESARRLGLTLSAWVRQCLGRAQRELSLEDPSRKLEALRAATSHSFPAPDVETMLSEIERGYNASDDA